MPIVHDSSEYIGRGLEATTKGIAASVRADQQAAMEERQMKLMEAKAAMDSAAADREREARIAAQRQLAETADRLTAIREGRERPPGVGGLGELEPNPMPNSIGTVGVDLAKMPAFAGHLLTARERDKAQRTAQFEAKQRGRTARAANYLEMDPEVGLRMIQRETEIMDLEKEDYERQNILGEIHNKTAGGAYIVGEEKEMRPDIADRVKTLMSLIDSGASPTQIRQTDKDITETVTEIEQTIQRVTDQTGLVDSTIQQYNYPAGSEERQALDQLKTAVRRSAGDFEIEDVEDKIFEITHKRKTARATGKSYEEKRGAVIEKLGNFDTLRSFPRAIQEKIATAGEITEDVIDQAMQFYYGTPQSPGNMGALKPPSADGDVPDDMSAIQYLDAMTGGMRSADPAVVARKQLPMLIEEFQSVQQQLAEKKKEGLRVYGGTGGLTNDEGLQDRADSLQMQILEQQYYLPAAERDIFNPVKRASGERFAAREFQSQFPEQWDSFSKELISKMKTDHPSGQDLVELANKYRIHLSTIQQTDLWTQIQAEFFK